MSSPKKLYGLTWEPYITPLEIEREMIRMGGQRTMKNGVVAGNGLEFHYKAFQSLLWPRKVWHRWNERLLHEFLTHRTIAILGAASTGKTHEAACFGISDWFCFPDETTVLICSTTKERLEDRIWGEIKSLFGQAKQLHPHLPGYIIEGRLRIVLARRSEALEGRDFRNGVIGVPCKRGETYVGLSDFIGIKNKRMRVIGDELSLLPGAFVDAISNLDKNPDLKAIGLGNPKDPLDALGRLAEPSSHMGGWEAGLDQAPGIKSWPTRRPDGVCVQLPGDDSPNLDGTLGAPLITREQMARDEAFYGRNSLWFSMFNLGQMPRGSGNRRVLTLQMCQKFGALKEPIWKDTARTKIAFLDAAYRGTGGDRCIFGTLEFGFEAQPEAVPDEVASAIIFQRADQRKHRQIIAVKIIKNVPINIGVAELPEDQIVDFVKKECQADGIEPTNFFFDAGMRTSLVTAFARNWSPLVNSIDFGGKPSGDRMVSDDIQILCKDYYSKFVTELWFNVSYAVQAAQVRGFTHEIVEEFAGREWGIVAGNKHEVEPKDAMKTKFGRSPDVADAIVCGFWGALQKGFHISKLNARNGSKKYDKSWDNFRQKARQLWKAGAIDE